MPWFASIRPGLAWLAVLGRELLELLYVLATGLGILLMAGTLGLWLSWGSLGPVMLEVLFGPPACRALLLSKMHDATRSDVCERPHVPPPWRTP